MVAFAGGSSGPGAGSTIHSTASSGGKAAWAGAVPELAGSSAKGCTTVGAAAGSTLAEGME
jgi:hypothetical protein